jgi:hypothetical protein
MAPSLRYGRGYQLLGDSTACRRTDGRGHHRRMMHVGREKFESARWRAIPTAVPVTTATTNASG